MIKKDSSKNVLLFLSFILSFGLIQKSSIAQTNPVKIANTVVEMIPQFKTVNNGQSFWVGFSFKPDEDWHIYWRNPGDSGLAPKIEWQLPEGFQSGEVKWPQPNKIEAAPLISFGYHEEVFIPIEIKSPPITENISELQLSTKVSWLACKVECIPGVTHFNIKLPITKTPPELNQTYFENYNRFKQLYPVKDVLDAFSIQQKESGFIIRYKPSQFIEGIDAIQFFPYDENIVDYVESPKFKIVNRSYEITIKESPHFQVGKSDRFRGIFAFQKKDFGQISPVEIDLLFKSNFVPIIMEKNFTGNIMMDIPLAVFFAFLGGLILNLMPCVLPVLTIKVLNLVEKSRSDQSKLFNHGVQFTMGIIVSFWFLAAMMIILRLAGNQIGWGFQFQSPFFVVSMAILFFMLALNLFGLFEIGTGLTRFKSTDFAFFNGVLATVVATPCTAPFMGAAIGFALSKSPAYTFLIFTAMGMGMAFPYLMLSRFPALLKFVPKPGPWMIFMKQLFGFVMLAVVIWLSWVISIQRSSEAVIILMIGLFLLALGAWLHAIGKKTKGIIILSFIIYFLGFYSSFQAARRPSIQSTVEESNKEKGINWEKFDPIRYEQYLADNKPVFLDFTAAWCLSCQVNEQTVFHNQKIIDRFNEMGIIPIKADWTNHDPEITEALNSFGKNSIPLYVFFPQGNHSRPVILPEIITPAIVLSIIDKYFVE